MSYHLMIDLETLSTRPDAAVVQMGAAIFDPDSAPGTILHEASWSVRPDLERCHVEYRTLCWWMNNPSNEVRARVFNQNTGHWVDQSSLNLILEAFVFGSVGSAQHLGGVWSHGAAFDLSILRFCKDPTPWSHWQERDTRTLAMACWMLGIDPDLLRPEPRQDRQHDALVDAREQAQWVQGMVGALKRQGATMASGGLSER